MAGAVLGTVNVMRREIVDLIFCAGGPWTVFPMEYNYTQTVSKLAYSSAPSQLPAGINMLTSHLPYLNLMSQVPTSIVPRSLFPAHQLIRYIRVFEFRIAT